MTLLKRKRGRVSPSGSDSERNEFITLDPVEGAGRTRRDDRHGSSFRNKSGRFAFCSFDSGSFDSRGFGFSNFQSGGSEPFGFESVGFELGGFASGGLLSGGFE